MYNYIRMEGRIPVNQTRLWASEMAYALHVLHEKNILYGDMKIENILIDAKGHIVLADFGLSSVLKPPYKEYKISGTFHYMAPGKQFGFESHNIHIVWCCMANYSKYLL